MTKIVTAKAMAELESLAYQEGCSEIDFMENAGRGIAEITHQYILQNSIVPSIWLLCGKGNNAGDAYVAGCYLLDKGYEVTAIQPDPLDYCSPLCRKNGLRFLDKKGKIINQFESLNLSSGVILDGIFGTGFKGQVREPYSFLIEKANSSGLPILAIDIPSGLDGNTGQIEGSVIHATLTIFLGLPKIGFFLESAWNVVGKLEGVDFGLPNHIVDGVKEDIELLTQDKMKTLLPPIVRNRHKYQSGYVIGLAGSPNMPGAAILASLASLRAGSGMVRLLYPKGMEAELSSSPYELIKIPYTYDQPENVIPIMQKARSTFVGPGLGLDDTVRNFLEGIIPFLEKPCVIDADALTLFADKSFKLPEKVILTPHRGEMQKLLKSNSSLILNDDLLKTCQKFAEEKKVTLILKGGPSFIFQPHQPISVNPTGDPGMATAGSGDVLTGMLASLLSQGLDCHDAACLGVYLHGLAGEFAARERGTSYGMVATDLIDQLSTAYHFLSN